jgi:hypothetical protein
LIFFKVAEVFASLFYDHRGVVELFNTCAPWRSPRCGWLAK